MYSLDFYNCNTIAVPAIYKQNGTANISYTRRYTLKYTNRVQSESYTKDIPKLFTIVYWHEKAIYKIVWLVYCLYKLWLYLLWLLVYIVYAKSQLLVQLLYIQKYYQYNGICFVSSLYKLCKYPLERFINSNIRFHYTLYSILCHGITIQVLVQLNLKQWN